MAKHPTSKGCAAKQKLKEKYAKLREDAQLYGVIPTVPEGAVRDERVPPASDPPQTGLVVEAIRCGWATPESKKPKIVDEMVALVECVEAKNQDRVGAAKVVMYADKMQYERDHPELSAKGINKRSAIDSSERVSWDRLASVAVARAKRDELEEMIQSVGTTELDKPSTGDNDATTTEGSQEVP